MPDNYPHPRITTRLLFWRTRFSIAAGQSNIANVPKGGPGRSRRKLPTARVRITAYYTEEEQREIVKAANKLRITLSGFVAQAVLREARRINSKDS